MYNYRFVARIVLEASTPLKIGSGESDFAVDAPVIKDWNGLPMILGTSIAGVLRHSFDGNKEEDIFGKYNGSRLLVSNAHLLDEKSEIHYGLGIDNPSNFLKRFHNLPIREHTAINDKGVALEHSKFDEEVVYAGSRFVFELELIGDKKDEQTWQEILTLINSPLFRLGGGSTKGFGEMKIVSCHESSYIIGKDYANKPNDLNVVKGKDIKNEIGSNANKYPLYKITIKPDDFFSFGSGFGDDEVDNIAVTEEIVKWKEDKGTFSIKQVLLPASRIQGALPHRTAFHYNKLKKVYADHILVAEFVKHVGENNTAVATIFGHKKESIDNKEAGKKGIALFSDVFKEFKEEEVKIFDHVKIDRFTGGAIDSALYNEKVIAQKDEWKIEIVLSDRIEDKNIKRAFENSLDDLCHGLLPLGGKVNRGHGVFVGKWEKENDNA